MSRSLLAFLSTLIFCLQLSAQVPTCTPAATGLVLHAEGLAERLGDLTISCSGGAAGTVTSTGILVRLNTNVTNRIDSNGILQGITITGATAQLVRADANNGIFFSNVTFSQPSATITISGIRAAVAPIAASSPATVTYSVVVFNANTASTAVTAGAALPTLLSSQINNFVPCTGSPLPATQDFMGFANASIASTIRITEASNSAFNPRQTGDDSGLRFVVRLTGYPANARVFLPDAITGNDAAALTSSGAFGSLASGGTYSPLSSQLLLIRVSGADANGAGGTLATSVPTVSTTFSAVSEISLTTGAGYAVYEVVDANPGVREWAQIPVFVSSPSVSCPNALTAALSVQLAPISNVPVATAVDPVPRFVTGVPAADCSVVNDCSASYVPRLMVDTTPLTFTSASKGSPQVRTVSVSNPGSGIVPFTVSVGYGTFNSPSWLTVSPSAGANNATLMVTADPSSLDPGIYTASIEINGGSFGSASVPITFTVGPVGVTVQAVVNAASYQSGVVAAGSYAAIFGLNLAGTDVHVTFNGLEGQVIYKSDTQINVIVPSLLLGQGGALVIVTSDGKASNAYRVNLALNSPGIFTPGIVNASDGTVNSASSPAARDSFVSVYLTGLTVPLTGQVTVNIGDQLNLVPQYAGAQGGFPALDQVNVLVPSALNATPNPVKLSVCIPTVTATPACSNQVDLFIK